MIKGQGSAVLRTREDVSPVINKGQQIEKICWCRSGQ